MAILGSYKSRYTGKEIDNGIDKANEALNKNVTINGQQFSETGAINLTKSDIGLGNVDNTSDVEKQPSNPTKVLINTEVGKVNANLEKLKTQISDYIDDVNDDITNLYEGKIDKSQGLNERNKLFVTNNIGNQIMVDKLPISMLPETGISVDSSKELVSEKGNLTANKIYDITDKNLYNLGRYDSVSGNVITRKTGYLTIESSDINNIITSQGNKVICCTTNVRVPENAYYKLNDYRGACNKTGFRTKTVSNYWVGAEDAINISATEKVIITTKNQVNNLEYYRNLCPIYVEYEMNVGYTEEIIKDSPIHTLNVDGEVFLKDEWKKTLNLCPVDVVKPRIVTTLIESLKAGYYTISLKNKSDGGANGTYNVIVDDNRYSDVSISENETILLTKDSKIGIYLDSPNENSVMILKGKIDYLNYQEYNGGIVHEKGLKDSLGRVKQETINELETKAITITIDNIPDDTKLYKNITIPSDFTQKYTRTKIVLDFEEEGGNGNEIIYCENSARRYESGMGVYCFQGYSNYFKCFINVEVYNIVDTTANASIEKITNFKTGVATVNNSDITVTTNSLKKNGNIVLFNFQYNGHKATTEAGFLSFPDGFKPKEKTTILMYGYGTPLVANSNNEFELPDGAVYGMFYNVGWETE